MTYGYLKISLARFVLASRFRDQPCFFDSVEVLVVGLRSYLGDKYTDLVKNGCLTDI